MRITSNVFIRLICWECLQTIRLYLNKKQISSCAKQRVYFSHQQSAFVQCALLTAHLSDLTAQKNTVSEYIIRSSLLMTSFYQFSYY